MKFINNNTLYCRCNAGNQPKMARQLLMYGVSDRAAASILNTYFVE